jgi:Peptidase family M28
LSRFLHWGCAAVLCFLLTLAPSFGKSTQSNTSPISTQEDIAQDIASVPCKDNERLNAVKALFVKMGGQADISIEKLDGIENLVARKAGTSQETIVIGAHYDKVGDGCGAIDNWTGIVALAHIYKSFKNVTPKKSLIFVAFGKEEKGLLGSKALVKTIKKEEIEQYSAMVNIDSLGMAAPQALENLSSALLVNRAAELAVQMKIPFSKVTINGADADSSSFIGKKIPAITISAVGDGWEKILHSNKDQLSIVNELSVYVGYRLALALVVELCDLPCGVSRK